MSLLAKNSIFQLDPPLSSPYLALNYSWFKKKSILTEKVCHHWGYWKGWVTDSEGNSKEEFQKYRHDSVTGKSMWAPRWWLWRWVPLALVYGKFWCVHIYMCMCACVYVHMHTQYTIYTICPIIKQSYLTISHHYMHLHIMYYIIPYSLLIFNPNINHATIIWPNMFKSLGW